MLRKDLSLNDPLSFLVRFALVAGVLFLLREAISEFYVATMVPLVNGLFSWEGMAVAYEQDRHLLQLTYTELSLRFKVHDIIYQNLMVAVALFVATPGYSLRWKGKWIVGVLGLLWLTHAASLYMGGYVIVWDFIEGLPPERRENMMRRVLAVFPRDRDWLFSHLFGLWHSWGRLTLVLFIWLYAARGYLGLSRAGAD